MVLMRVNVTVGAVAFALCVLRPAAAQPMDLSGVEEVVQAAIASGEIPGAVVLVGRAGEVLYHRAFGARRLVPVPSPMSEDTVFDVASLTKPLGTTLAVMSLVEGGRIRLDAPIGRYLREFRGSAFRQVTVRHLLTHRAGLPGVPPDDAVRPGFPRAVRALAALTPDYAPGSAFQYSDTGFILLAEIVRRVSGERLDRYLARRFFGPLGLTDTMFRPPPRLRARIAPTEIVNGRLLWGEAHDPLARLLGGVAGHAGMFSTARDLARLCQMLVNEGSLGGRRFLRPATIRAMWTPWPTPDPGRALGWDVMSQFAQTMGPFFPPGSVGHTGFTGTSVWIDPTSRSYMIVLTNRVHPYGAGAARIRELRTRVAAEVGAALFHRPDPLPGSLETRPGPGSPLAESPPVRTGQVLTGLDALGRQGFALLRGRVVGLITNHTGIDAQRRRGLELLAAAPDVRVAAIFAPEHGLGGDANTSVGHGVDQVTRLPVWSLYGASKRPTPGMLAGLTALVFDIQDVGVRYYTYLTTLVYVLETAAERGIPVYVLDRPNPITGRIVEGPLLDADLRSFTGPHTIPVRSGLTIGEFARLVAAEQRIPVHLTVVPLIGWDRSLWFDETGLPWTNPSPNIRSVTQALLYSGLGLLEATNLSVGRGTDVPFEVVGAPWVEPQGLAEALNHRGLPGVWFHPTYFTPSADKFATLQCGGVWVTVTNRETIRPVTVALAIASELRARHRDQFRPEAIQNLLVNRSTMWAFLRNEPLERLLAWADMARASFLQRRAPYLIYG
jgi:uncharacterized protein YbbC (DUF1343 family)/CubicO group peptidase (beta-lactamase class C family)